MKFPRRILKISYREHATNESVQKKHQLQCRHSTTSRTENIEHILWLGHVCRHNSNQSNREYNNNNNICLFQIHKIGTAYICRSIHIEIQNFNTRQSILRTVHNNDNITSMTVMLSYYVMMHVQCFYPVPPNARGPSNV